ncbi:MAG: type IV pilin protein [Calditrichota bacterium]
MNKSIFIKADEGFSLTEILVVIVIIGILVLLALPQFTSVITQAKTAEAKIMLKHLHTLQQTFYYQHDRYGVELADIGFEQNTTMEEHGEARYRIEIENADLQGYIAKAIAVVDFDKDGIFNVWQVDQTGAIRQVVAD